MAMDFLAMDFLAKNQLPFPLPFPNPLPPLLPTPYWISLRRIRWAA